MKNPLCETGIENERLFDRSDDVHDNFEFNASSEGRHQKLRSR